MAVSANSYDFYHSSHSTISRSKVPFSCSADAKHALAAYQLSTQAPYRESTSNN